MRQLEGENSRLKRLVADLTLDKQMFSQKSGKACCQEENRVTSYICQQNQRTRSLSSDSNVDVSSSIFLYCLRSGLSSEKNKRNSNIRVRKAYE